MPSGSSSPSATISSTSATHTLPAVATLGLKLRAVLRYTRLPAVSVQGAWILATAVEPLTVNAPPPVSELPAPKVRVPPLMVVPPL